LTLIFAPCTRSQRVPRVLGYVLAHEIVHILEGQELHSPSGIMKGHWNSRDFAEMQGAGLKFTEMDIDQIDVDWIAHSMERRTTTSK
jgi:hypothetical protein